MDILITFLLTLFACVTWPYAKPHLDRYRKYVKDTADKADAYDAIMEASGFTGLTAYDIVAQLEKPINADEAFNTLPTH